MCNNPNFKILPTGIPGTAGNPEKIKHNMVRMKCSECDCGIGLCCMCRTLLHLEGSPTDDSAHFSFENDGGSGDGSRNGSSGNSLSLAPSQSSSSKSIPIIPNKTHHNSNHRYHSDEASFAGRGYGVVCPTCEFPNLLLAVHERIESFAFEPYKYAKWLLVVELTLEEFIVACVCNNQPLDFGAKAQQLLDAEAPPLKGGQDHVKKKRIRRRSKTVSSRKTDSRFQSMKASHKAEIILLKELAKRVASARHIQMMALHLYCGRDELFTPFDLSLLELAFEEGGSISSSKSAILAIAGSVVDRRVYSQKLKTRALKELCNLEYGMNTDVMIARSQLNLDFQDATNRNKKYVESMRAGLSIIGREVCRLLCLLCEMGDSSRTTTGLDHYKESVKILRDKTHGFVVTQSNQFARSMKLLHLLIKLFSTIIMF